MSATFTTNIYGFTGLGKKTCIGQSKKTDATAFPVGGKIFYIDTTSTGGTYTFYDSEGDELTDVRVGDSPFAYKITGTPSKDKYYIFYPTVYTGKTWGGYGTLQGVTTDGIGQGKIATATCLGVSALVDTTNTIWQHCLIMRTNEIADCDDWFVPSRAELEYLRNAVDRDGNALLDFSGKYIWSSTESSAYDARFWYSSCWNNRSKSSGYSLVAARAF